MASLTAGSAARSLGHHWKSFSLLFYRAVRDLKPVWMLEDMRTMEAFYPEDDSSQRTYSPSEALLYAIVHDHQAYAQFLLSRFPGEALAEPGERFSCCPASSSVPHQAMAVRYDRRYILQLILQESRGAARAARAPGCFHEGRSPLHLACELLRPEAAVLLLGAGASPLSPDRYGLTPLDVLLDKLGNSTGAVDGEGRRCLDNLLMFMPKVHFKMRGALDRDPESWTEVLGDDTYRYLAGRSPASLLLIAMQTVMKQLSPETFSDSLHELPIPSSLKPRGLPVGPRVSDPGSEAPGLPMDPRV
ncbi:ankyrin repeat domain-containing protein 9 [Cololabis saira]|uniref:ankyrin repeat domain-containing protein 9 n=1 Tax=Cololabis saira TaxID=129043 RepID=UPI002AD330AC|nr:ankyrin repeat domain-containing protein 9 [Cololabis saira]